MKEITSKFSILKPPFYSAIILQSKIQEELLNQLGILTHDLTCCYSQMLAGSPVIDPQWQQTSNDSLMGFSAGVSPRAIAHGLPMAWASHSMPAGPPEEQLSGKHPDSLGSKGQGKSRMVSSHLAPKVTQCHLPCILLVTKPPQWQRERH